MKAPYPNNLKTLVKNAGWTIQGLHIKTGIPQGTLYYWNSGKGVIAAEYREKIAKIIGCDPQDLAPLNDVHNEPTNGTATVSRMQMTELSKDITKSLPLFEENAGCFSFGKLKTTSMILDGDGTEVYLPANIRTHYEPMPAIFFEEVMQAKKQIRQEQQEKQENGDPYQWNGEKYHLSKIVISREPIHERMTLGLWFKPRDHYVGLATRKCLDDPEFRAKYLPEDWDWNSPTTGFSCSMGVDLAVVSSDRYVFLTQRGQNQSIHRNMFTGSVSEAVSPSFDRSTTGQAPDLYRCASRGLAEEFGLHESIDFFLSDILFLSFSVDTHYALYGLRGIVKVKKGADEILQSWRNGVKDKMENKKVIPVPFTPKEVSSFVFSHQSFAGGLVCLYHALVHEFGREEVDRIISSY